MNIYAKCQMLKMKFTFTKVITNFMNMQHYLLNQGNQFMNILKTSRDENKKHILLLVALGNLISIESINAANYF